MIEKVYISYFYQIRFFTPNLVPLSTAIWDPKWYHQMNEQDYIFKDKNGVLNGLRINPLHPQPHNDGCIECNRTGDPTTCDFIRIYTEQLRAIDFNDFMIQLEKYLNKINSIYLHYTSVEYLTPVFIVHEAPNNKCSERGPLFKWFSDNGVKCEEWKRG